MAAVAAAVWRAAYTAARIVAASAVSAEFDGLEWALTPSSYSGPAWSLPEALVGSLDDLFGHFAAGGAFELVQRAPNCF